MRTPYPLPDTGRSIPLDLLYGPGDYNPPYYYPMQERQPNEDPEYSIWGEHGPMVRKASSPLLALAGPDTVTDAGPSVSLQEAEILRNQLSQTKGNGLSWEDIKQTIPTKMLDFLAQDRRIGAPQPQTSYGERIAQNILDTINRWRATSEPEPGLQTPDFDPIDAFVVPGFMGLGKATATGYARTMLPGTAKTGAAEAIPELGKALRGMGNPFKNLWRSIANTAQQFVNEATPKGGPIFAAAEYDPLKAKETLSRTLRPDWLGHWRIGMQWDNPRRYPLVMWADQPAYFEPLTKSFPQFRSITERGANAFYTPISQDGRFLTDLVGGQTTPLFGGTSLTHEVKGHMTPSRLRGIGSYLSKPERDIARDQELWAEFMPGKNLDTMLETVGRQAYPQGVFNRLQAYLPNKSQTDWTSEEWRRLGEEFTARVLQGQFPQPKGMNALVDAVNRIGERHMPQFISRPILPGPQPLGEWGYPME